MDDIFYDLYKGCYLQTVASRRARETFESLLDLVTAALGEKKTDELQMAANIVLEEEGLRGFIEGFRLGMTVISEAL